VPDLKRHSLVKPTIQTRFHIDFDWWAQNDNDWHVLLAGFLCPQHQEFFSTLVSSETPGGMGNEVKMVDWVDPVTAEVQRVDGVQHALISHCAKQEAFITPHTTVVDAIFRLFLANGNSPLTPIEMADHLGRPAETILRTLAGGRVYRGLRPFLD
jgi:hypothetical protein